MNQKEGTSKSARTRVEILGKHWFWRKSKEQPSDIWCLRKIRTGNSEYLKNKRITKSEDILPSPLREGAIFRKL